MELAQQDQGGNLVEHSASSQSESSMMEKTEGSAHIMQKSSSFQEEESYKMVSQSDLEERLLKAAGCGGGGRPTSLPPDLNRLWHSLKIANELNQFIAKENSQANQECEPANTSKQIDFTKLFTPAADAPEIQPKRGKVFASSSFYGPNHPTMEEQVNLARRISSSLSDISNKESKGQTMYINRKKRSVKWVHQGGELRETAQSSTEFNEVLSENLPPIKEEKPVLKLVMNPRGRVQQDISSSDGPSGLVDQTPSPEICFDLVKDLNSPCGKGAELFAKRRKRAEKWVVDESTVKHSAKSETFESTSSSMVSGQKQLPSTPLSALPTQVYMKDVPPRFNPAFSNKNDIPERFNEPRVRLIKSPWEAALEGNVESAFADANSRGAPSPRGSVLVAPATLPPPTSRPIAPQSADSLSRLPRPWNPQPQCNSYNGESPGLTVQESSATSNGSVANAQHLGSAAPCNLNAAGGTNYNTAPRGWQRNMLYYRPVTFQPPTSSFTDF